MANPEAQDANGRALKTFLTSAGVLLIVAAIVGGAVEGAGFKVPAINSLPRQLLLAFVGLILLLIGLSSTWGSIVTNLWHHLFDPRPPPAAALLPPDPIHPFVGRELELSQLHAELRAAGRVTITGLGGIGKTQLAAWYCHLHRNAYAHIFWLSGDRIATLTTQLVSIAWRLELPQRELHDQTVVIDAVSRWLHDDHDWLLVVDDLDEKVASSFDRLLGPGLEGHVIVTSRHPMSGARLLLDPLELDVAADFIINRTGQRDVEAARAVANTLGCLPLAIEQASAYVDQTGERLRTYSEQLGSGLGRLLTNVPGDQSANSVATTWTLSFKRVEREWSGSADLLRLSAFFAPDAIPLDLLQSAALELKGNANLRRAVRDRFELNKTMSVLLRYSLVKRHGDNVNIHRLVQAVIRDSLSPAGQRRWAAAAVQILAAVMPSESWRATNWPTCERLLPHILAITDDLLLRQPEQQQAGYLLDRAGGYLASRSEFSLAQPLVERAVAHREQALGSDHLDTANSVGNLGMVLWAQGDLTSARPYLERALATKTAAVGPDDVRVGTTLNSLGLLLWAQGDMAGAKHHFERSLAIAERALGADHPVTAISFNNLGGLLQDQGDLSAARPYLERAVWLSERVASKDHVSTASSLNNMGLLLQSEGDLSEAEAYFERALKICERVGGTQYPDIAASLNNLGTVGQARGDFSAARSYYERALALRERLLGPDHRYTAVSLNNLGALLEAHGDLADARPCLERALAIFQGLAVPEHPYTAASLNNLGVLEQDEGNVVAARECYERAFAVCRRVLTNEHPHTVACRENLQALMQSSDNLVTGQQDLTGAADGTSRPQVSLIGSHLRYIS